MENYDHECFLQYMFEAGWREVAPGEWVELGSDQAELSYA